MSMRPHVNESLPHRCMRLTEPFGFTEIKPHDMPCTPKSATAGTAGLKAALTAPTFVSLVVVTAFSPLTCTVTLPPQAAPSTRRPSKTWLSIGDTECYAAIQTEWPMLRPPTIAAALIKATCPESLTSTSAVLLETMPFAFASTEGSRKLLAGRNPAGSVPATHTLVEA